MSPEERAAIVEANRPPHGKADRVISALLAEVDRLEAERDAAIAKYENFRATYTNEREALANEERDAAQRALAEMTTQRDAYRETNASIALQRESPEMASQLVVAQRALAAAQADAARLRAALQRLADDDMPVNVQNFARHALAAPAGDEALREFGLRVATQARKVHATFGGSQVDAAATVDAVLRGER